MTTATRIDAETLKAGLSAAFSLCERRLNRLVEAIMGGEVSLSDEKVTLNQSEWEVRKAFAFIWLNNACMPAEWCDTIGYSLRVNVRSLEWIPELGELRVTFK